MKQVFTVLAAVLLLGAVLNAQKRDAPADSPVRSALGVVLNDSDTPVAGAVVQLKNTRTLEIRSFITRDEGKFHFHGLSTNIDYEISASHEGRNSNTRTLSSFDSRKQAFFTLKLGK